MRRNRKAEQSKKGESGPTKFIVQHWSYIRLVSKALTNIDSDVYDTYLSPETLTKHFEWLDSGWSSNKNKSKKVGNRRRRTIRQRSRQRPSLKFCNSVLSRFNTLILKMNKDIKKYSAPPEVEPKRKPKISRTERVKTAKKSQGDYITYYTDFVDTYVKQNGITRPLITSLIKVGCLPYVVLFHRFHELEGGDSQTFIRSYIDPSQIDSNLYEYFIASGIPLNNDIRIYLKLSTESDQLENLTKKFTPADILSNINLISHRSVMTLLVKEEIINVDKKSCKALIKKSDVSSLIPIVEAAKYTPTITDINNLFKITQRSARRRRRYYYWRHQKQYNTNLSAKKEEIDHLLRLLINQNIKIPFSKPIFSYLLNHGTPSLICAILSAKSNPDYPFDKKWEKVRENVKITSGYRNNHIVHNTIVNDDLQAFKLLIDNNLLPIPAIHHDNSYLITAIRNSSEKIALYMIDELRVKLLNWNPRSIWGWNLHRKTQEEIIKDLDFMTRHKIPLSPNLLGTFLCRQKTKIVNHMVELLGFKLNSSHVKYIKTLDVKTFNKYADQIGVNKLKMLSGLARLPKPRHEYWRVRRHTTTHRRKNAIALNIISSQPRNEKAKLAKRIGQIALNNNNPTLYTTLKNRYKFGYTLKEIKSMVSRKSYSCGDHRLINNIKASQPELFEKIKGESNEFKIRLLFCNVTKSNMKKEQAQNVVDLDTIPSKKVISNLIDIASNEHDPWWGHNIPQINSDSRTYLTRVIRQTMEYKSRDPTQIKDIVYHLIQKNGATVINSLCSKKYDLYSTLSLRDVYTLCLQTMVQNKDLANTIRFVERYAKTPGSNLTPLLWTLIRLGVRYTEADDAWYRIRPTKAQIMNLTKVQNTITLEDREFINTYGKVGNKLRTVKYEKTDEETPEEYEFYVRAALNRINYQDLDMISEDMELALDNFEAELLDELGDDAEFLDDFESDDSIDSIYFQRIDV